MSVAVLGGTGTLGRIMQVSWPEAQYFGRSATPREVEGATCLIDMRGIVPGRGDLQQNIAIAQQALDLAQTAGIAHVILPSTAAVYDRLPGPQREDQAAPRSEYAKSKIAMEEMAAAHPQSATALRIGNVAGADAVLGQWRPGFALDQLADGTTPRRTYIGLQSFGLGLKALAACADLPAVLNFAAPAVIEMGALLDAAGLAWSPRPASPQTIASVEMDLTRLSQTISLSGFARTPEALVAEWRLVKDKL